MDINEFLKNLDNASNTKMKRNEIYDKCKYSVSKILEVIKRPFEKDKIAMMCFTKGFNDPESKYYHMSVEEILKSWQDKANIGMANGKILDTFIGLTLDVFTPQDIIDKYVSSIGEIPYKKCMTFREFNDINIKSGKLKYLTREKILADESLGVVGRFDALFQINDNTLLLVDWKNTENIETSNKWNKLLGPLSEYDECDYNLYTVQLYIYVYILRKKYHLTDVKIIPMIVQIGTDGYKMYTTSIPYSDELVENIIEFAKNEINK